MSFRDRDPQAHTDSAGDWPPRRAGAGDRRGSRQRITTAVLRVAPVLAAIAWLAFSVAQYGPTGQGAAIGKALLITFGISVAFAFASGVYEPRRAARWLRSRLPRRRIDWDAFDEARARWERHRR